MRRMILFSMALCLVAHSTLAASVRSSPNYSAQAQQLSAEQLDNVLASIALYPDPLLAQVLPASTFVEQIDQAARWLRANPNNIAGVDSQSWDVSVKSVAHYPQVIYMMAEKMDWTTALGQSYVNQSTDVFTSIQRLRAKAKGAGNLKSSKEQTIVVEQEVIKIVPAQPQVIYVPTYNPQVVYVQAPPPSGPSTGSVVAASAIAFGTGLAIGAWLNNDCNWRTHSVYYHGWQGTGWVSTSSRYVHTSSVYVNRSFSTVNVNRTVVNRNVNYNNINHYNSVSRNVNYNNVQRNNVNVNNVQRNNVNNTTGKNVSANSEKVNSARGQTGQSAAASTQRAQSSSAFGGQASAGTTERQSQRGQASRESAQSSSRSSGGDRSGGGGRSGGEGRSGGGGGGGGGGRR